VAVQELKAPKVEALCGKSPKKSPNTGRVLQNSL